MNACRICGDTIDDKGGCDCAFSTCRNGCLCNADLIEGGEGHTPITITYTKPLRDQRVVVRYDERGMVQVTREALEPLLAAAGFRAIGHREADGQPQH